MNTIDKLSSNISLAGRQILFLKADTNDYHCESVQVIWLSMISMSFVMLCTYLIYLPAPEFNDYALPGFAFSISLLLLTAFAIEQLFIKNNQFLVMSTIFIAIDTVFNVPGMLYYWFYKHYQYKVYEMEYGYLIYMLSVFILIWFIVVILRAVHNFFPLSKLKHIAAGLLIFMLYFIPSSYFSEQLGTFWHASYGDTIDKDNPYDKVNVEDVFYQQYELVHSLSNALFEERQDRTDLYFLGFSSYATQDVFYKEVKYAQRLMDARFDTSGRSALLINHLETYEKEPLANSHNLKIMLDGISERMNSEQDILFLYLTSHGGEKHNLSVKFWPLKLNDLTPDILKKQLDESGIKWRILVVSSCYSGGYIKPLEDDYTLIFTASAVDRQSFGCSNENEFTWFGEAIFKFALNKNASIIDAFEQAMIYIQDKEKTQEVESSQPQLSIGKNIELKLRQYTAEIQQKYKQSSTINIALITPEQKTPEETETTQRPVHLNN